MTILSELDREYVAELRSQVERLELTLRSKTAEWGIERARLEGERDTWKTMAERLLAERPEPVVQKTWQKTCERCHEPFLGTYKTARFCADCVKARRGAAHREVWKGLRRA